MADNSIEVFAAPASSDAPDRRPNGRGRDDDDNVSENNGNISSLNHLPMLAPGECRPDVVIEVTGNLVYCLQLSPSFSFFTVRLSNNEEDDRGDGMAAFDVLDVLLTRKDGWENNPMDDIESIWRNKNESEHQVVTVTVRGYPERMRRKCPTDTDCIRLHALSIRIEDREVYEAKRQEPLASPSQPPPPPNNTKNARGANDGSRFGKMVEFLLENFGGYEGLLSGGGSVLDVAGGAGGLAFELAVRNAIPCIVVDPRPVKYKGYQLRHLEFRKNCLKLLSTAPKCSTMADNLKNRFQIQDVLQLSTLLETSRVLVDDNDDSRHQLGPLDDVQQQLHDLLHNQQCSVLVGLHPDEATIPIVDIGLALQLPWVVVPCCVFPNLFQQRLLKSGKRVRSYEDLCQFIIEKDPDNIRQAELPFRGRNLALYWHPPTSTKHK